MTASPCIVSPELLRRRLNSKPVPSVCQFAQALRSLRELQTQGCSDQPKCSQGSNQPLIFRGGRGQAHRYASNWREDTTSPAISQQFLGRAIKRASQWYLWRLAGSIKKRASFVGSLKRSPPCQIVPDRTLNPIAVEKRNWSQAALTAQPRRAMHGSPCKFTPSFCGFSAIERERAPPLSHSRPARVFAHVPVKGRAGPLHGEPHLLCLLGRAVLVPVASDLLGVVVPHERHAQVGKTVPEVASTGEAETRISACSRSGFDVVLPTGPPRFLRRVPEIEGL